MNPALVALLAIIFGAPLAIAATPVPTPDRWGPDECAALQHTVADVVKLKERGTTQDELPVILDLFLAQFSDLDDAEKSHIKQKAVRVYDAKDGPKAIRETYQECLDNVSIKGRKSL